ncbi:MAG: response regulator transcription factor [Comamonadaceae bacterium]|nr:MAG: response regulator transcription factor [Comamonadaceae bacterium]
MRPTALIAEDEALLAQALRQELAQAWPELEVIAVSRDGIDAVDDALRLLPDVLFLDIRMPGRDGLEVAAELADAWPDDRKALPQLVFVTAYDEYAVRAFEARAADYVLKPVQPERLRKTVARLQASMSDASGRNPMATAPHGNTGPPLDMAAAGMAFEATLERWRSLLAAAASVGAGPSPVSDAPEAGPLLMIAASEPGSQGTAVRMVPVDRVLYFEAADKYVRVLTADREYLIRTPLRQLLPQLDPAAFWQVHRSVVVAAEAIESVSRDEAGRQHLTLRGRPERLAVSRLFAHRFKAM